MTARMPVAAGALAMVLLAGCGGGQDTSAAEPGTPPAASASAGGPVQVDNCGTTYTYGAPPERIVTSSTVATEVVLALGLKDRMAGTVAAKDILPQYAPDLAGVRVVAESAFPPPSREVVYAANPDLVVSGYPDDYGPKAMGDRARLQKDGVNTYLLSASCPGHTATVEDTYGDLRRLGKVFGVEARAEQLAAALKAEVDAVVPRSPAVRVFDYAGGKEKPMTTGSTAMYGDLVRRAGGVDIFPEVTEFGQVGWEEVVNRDPEVIVVEDQVFEPAAKSIAWMRSYAPIKNVTAVKENRFVVVPVNDLQPGLRSGRALKALAEGFAR
ncbi:iron complex transport system substrate-binding protein [Sinosporangium album]|uniref:Iron complex transport system substrate-binding protein n=1 Tax=Sinosporangium album TaxID=504805 RepID=A0A1G7ZT54_9ACTN|nr:ABC transporter substrate-binding protein [Sinosporangium album]SDH11902.1 iron complex transport system substrate-binding protein [Sinosporangium album]